MAQDPRALEQQAKKTFESAQGATSGFAKLLGFGSGGDKYERAAELYTDAANAYRAQRMNKESGKARLEAARILKDKLNQPREAATAMAEAFNMFRKEDPAGAIECIQQAIGLFTAEGQFRRAATHMENAAELLEVEMGDRKKAMDFYNQAAQWYEDDRAQALANKLYLKEADIAALEGDYYRAVANYEKVADASLENHLMKYSIKEYWLKAGLCILATKDLVAAHRNLEGYKQKDPSFAGQRECQLLTDLIEAVEAGNQEAFTDKLYAYDQMSRLDKWKTEILPFVQTFIDSIDSIMSLPMVLLHKDFGSCNIMVDKDTFHLVGVIDWAEAEVCPFGLNLHSLQELPGKLHLRDGWTRYVDYDSLQEVFWSTFEDEIGRLRQAIRMARVLGLLLTSRLGNEPMPVPIDVDEQGRYNLLSLDGFLINQGTKFDGLE
ncbi:hypothetical protein NEMBOFW57_004339 [Staphylotrichum longicolle]|uniref:Aminoglycoside phosphotransferase domain-containing protein n=1 Tax=Staphylotrichum longicolle TaxID=669026 RepID=A0AAD4F6Y3_9PEZI|nr:hypothetical protein NEMBOFW57_004339 [Staphylotrichum longicolle]